MSARRLSIEMRMTLQSGGGDDGGVAADGAAGVVPGVAEPLAVTGGSGVCAEAGCAGGASFEQAVAISATAREGTPRVIAPFERRLTYDSTVI
jgi:hypothetical protein